MINPSGLADTQRFRAYGLAVKSSIALPHVPVCETAGGACDVEIIETSVPPRLTDPEMVYRYWSARDGELLLNVPNVGRFYITNGSLIRFERGAGAALDDIAPYLLGSCFGAILHQRAALALHAASVCRGGRVFLICGRSGAGKSTTTAHLRARGGDMLCDDLAVIRAEAPYLVEPGLPHTNLADDALDTLGMPADRTALRRSAKGKLMVPAHEIFVPDPIPLGGIIVIERSSNAPLGSQRLAPQTAMQALRRHTYRKNYITRSCMQTIFSGWGKLAHAVPLWQITRPLGHDTIREVVAMAEQAIDAMIEEKTEPCA